MIGSLSTYKVSKPSVVPCSIVQLHSRCRESFQCPSRHTPAVLTARRSCAIPNCYWLPLKILVWRDSTRHTSPPLVSCRTFESCRRPRRERPAGGHLVESSSPRDLFIDKFPRRCQPALPGPQRRSLGEDSKQDQTNPPGQQPPSPMTRISSGVMAPLDPAVATSIAARWIAGTDLSGNVPVRMIYTT